MFEILYIPWEWYTETKLHDLYPLISVVAPNHIANPTELSVVVASIELYQQTLEGNTMLLKGSRNSLEMVW